MKDKLLTIILATSAGYAGAQLNQPQSIVVQRIEVRSPSSSDRVTITPDSVSIVSGVSGASLSTQTTSGLRGPRLDLISGRGKENVAIVASDNLASLKIGQDDLRNTIVLQRGQFGGQIGVYGEDGETYAMFGNESLVFRKRTAMQVAGFGLTDLGPNVSLSSGEDSMVTLSAKPQSSLIMANHKDAVISLFATLGEVKIVRSPE